MNDDASMEADRMEDGGMATAEAFAVQCFYLAGDLLDLSTMWPDHTDTLRKLANEVTRLAGELTRLGSSMHQPQQRNDNIISIESFARTRSSR
jgi:hypothetical protein